MALKERGIVLDRWWWSTIAYGWYGGLKGRVEKDSFFGAVDMVWRGVDADLIFLFLSPHAEDKNNADSITAGYEFLRSRDSARTVLVPQRSSEQTTEFIVSELRSHGLVNG